MSRPDMRVFASFRVDVVAGVVGRPSVDSKCKPQQRVDKTRLTKGPGR